MKIESSDFLEAAAASLRLHSCSISILGDFAMEKQPMYKVMGLGLMPRFSTRLNRNRQLQIGLTSCLTAQMISVSCLL